LISTGLFSPLALRSGARLRNRIAKAAMEEGMAGRSQLPDERLISLYRRWGAGGAGHLITGKPVTWPDKTPACDQRTQRRALGRYRAGLETRA
jgi:2,4-dienoyl-CoA reductase-like NADH-dependent reductase (Old Yellow Enzyme family)